MNVIGIIAEYNPFHNGHAYQIQKIKECTGADHIVIAMSGDYVQRGAPAIIDKYARARMALNCGASLVVELPVLWATASAEAFAMAGVTLFEKTGCVDGICFGAETDDLPFLSMLADILVEEPDGYRQELTSLLKKGLSFPAARAEALLAHLDTVKDGSRDKEAVSSILSTPNNILSIEYLKALKRRNSSIIPHLLKREGAGYHETATAIRKELAAFSQAASIDTDSAHAPGSSLTDAMPTASLEVLDHYLDSRSFLSANDFSSVLGYKLLTSDPAALSSIGDASADIANRLFKNRMQFTSFTDFCEKNKSKDMTYTRMSRILLHLILNLTASDYQHARELDYIPYLRVLGFRSDAAPLMKELKRTALVPIITKLADAASLLSTDANMILEKDIFAADFYEQVCAIKKGTTPRSEYTREIVRV